MKATAIAAMILLSVFQVAAQNDLLKLEKGVEPHAGVDRIYRDFSLSYKTFDSKKLAGLYTEDAAYLSPSRAIVYGNPAIYKSFRGMFNRVRERGRTMKILFTIVKRNVAESVGYDVGTFDLYYYENGKQVVHSRGKFVVGLEKGSDGMWRFAVDGYSDLKSDK